MEKTIGDHEPESSPESSDSHFWTVKEEDAARRK